MNTTRKPQAERTNGENDLATKQAISTEYCWFED